MNSGPFQKEVNRRQFLKGLAIGLGAAIAAAVASPIIGYFLSPAWKKTAIESAIITRLADLPLNEPQFVTYEERTRDGWFVSTASKGAWLVKKSDEDVIAFDPHCTHLNCPYYWDNQSKTFQCPCHGGVFNIDGKVLAGPPPRPLDRLETVIQDGNILATGKIIRGS